MLFITFESRHMAPARPPPPPTTTTKCAASDPLKCNLIDLDAWLDASDMTSELSALELFDPLLQADKQHKQSSSSNSNNKPSVDESAKPPTNTQPPQPQPQPQQAPTTTTTAVAKNNARSEVPRQREAIENRRIRSFTLTSSSSDAGEVLNSEQAEFCRLVSSLHSQVSMRQKELANLVVFSPVLDCPVSTRVSQLHLRIYIRISNTNHSETDIDSSSSTSTRSSNNNNSKLSLAVSINATVETIVYNVLTMLEIDELDTGKYLLKIHGLEEYLPLEATLAELAYIHECLIESREPTLVLVELRHVNTELTIRYDELERAIQTNGSSTTTATDASSRHSVRFFFLILLVIFDFCLFQLDI